MRVVAILILMLVSTAAAAQSALDIVIGGETRRFTREALLARPDVANVSIANDIAYGGAATYRAVPLAALLAGLTPPVDSVIESVALDGFAAQLPLDLV